MNIFLAKLFCNQENLFLEIFRKIAIDFSLRMANSHQNHEWNLLFLE